MKWFPMFSFSGRELQSLAIVFEPDLILTDKLEFEALWLAGKTMHLTPIRIRDLLMREEEECLVTLHGYRWILPPEVIQKKNLTIINVHPGDVVAHPELVGKDPQRKALNLGLKSTGVVIHRVTEDLDMGPVLRRKVVAIEDDETEASLISKLRSEAFPMWVSILEEYEIKRRNTK